MLITSIFEVTLAKRAGHVVVAIVRESVVPGARR
jgi:hypothetical protein